MKSDRHEWKVVRADQTLSGGKWHLVEECKKCEKYRERLVSEFDVIV